MTDERLSVSRRIAAPASTIFAVVTDPQGHVDIDGSGMLTAAPDAKPVRAVGDTFVMKMDREPLGDLPMGKYEVTNTVTRFAPDALIEWSISGVMKPPVGHVYGYLLKPVGENETEVTNYCDWSNLNEVYRGKAQFPIVPAHMLKKSLAKLETLVAPQRG